MSLSTTKILRYNKKKRIVEEFDKRPPVTGDAYLGCTRWGVGVESVGAGCHPSQVEEFNEDARKAGLMGVEFMPNGNVRFSSRRARARYLRHMGLYDRDAGYSDPAPNNL